MIRPAVIVHVVVVHTALLAAAVLVLGLAGRPIRGAVLGGGVMALSTLLFAATARAALAAQRLFVATLASFKVFLYLGLAIAALTGRIVADGAGFAAGVTCFVLAVVTVALLGSTTGEAA